MDEVPRLLDICVDYVANNLETITAPSEGKKYTLLPGVVLPAEVSDLLFKLIVKDLQSNQDADPLPCNSHSPLHIFSNTKSTRLSRVNLNYLEIDDDIINSLLQHRPVELNLIGCTGMNTRATLMGINHYGDRLRALLLSGHQCFVDDIRPGVLEKSSRGGKGFGVDYLVDCPSLRILAMQQFCSEDSELILTAMLSPLTQLVCLDLSGCTISMDVVKVVQKLDKLTTLTLHNVDYEDFSATCEIMAKLKQLRALDLSQSKDDMFRVKNPEVVMRKLVTALPLLTCLDLSGTNLAGLQPDMSSSHRLAPKRKFDPEKNEEEDWCPISFLKGRHLQFLGLLSAGYDACFRQNLPSNRVTGIANEDQVLESMTVYMDRNELLQVAMHKLFVMAKDCEVKDNHKALTLTLDIMERYLGEVEIQIIGSATLYYMSKPELQSKWGKKLRTRIIGVLVNAMRMYSNEAVLLRNCSLTMCNFNIPKDVLMYYETLMGLLVQIVTPPATEEFVQRIGVYLLNCLACQVGGEEKTIAGNSGCVQAMLLLISEKLSENKCDEVMETAWSMLWNVTDETPENSKRFLDGNGIELFNSCLEDFKQQEDLIRNMMGLMGNIAEVPGLRSQLLTPHLLDVFVYLLDSNSDGIEVSYNSCGVLAHLVSDKNIKWPVPQPSKQEVMQKMEFAIRNWPLKVKRNINYRSFEPILRLLEDGGAVGSQMWAVWALCNLTKMYKAKYCALLDKEGGIEILRDLINRPNVPDYTCELAKVVLDRCRKILLNLRWYEMNTGYQSDQADENDAEPSEMEQE